MEALIERGGGITSLKKKCKSGIIRFHFFIILENFKCNVDLTFWVVYNQNM